MSKETKGWITFIGYLVFVAISVGIIAYLSTIAPEPLPSLCYAP